MVPLFKIKIAGISVELNDLLRDEDGFLVPPSKESESRPYHRDRKIAVAMVTNNHWLNK